MYNILGSSKNYPNQLKTVVQNCFNKTMLKLQIEIKLCFICYINLWI